MTMRIRHISSLLTAGALLLTLTAGAEESPLTPESQPDGEQAWAIDWYKIAGGGTVASHGGQWALGGTIGQHDDTAANELQGGSWSLTGGFWAANREIDQRGLIFRDRFEE